VQPVDWRGFQAFAYRFKQRNTLLQKSKRPFSERSLYTLRNRKTAQSVARFPRIRFSQRTLEGFLKQDSLPILAFGVTR